jgi:hypothetical protein
MLTCLSPMKRLTDYFSMAERVKKRRALEKRPE